MTHTFDTRLGLAQQSAQEPKLSELRSASQSYGKTNNQDIIFVFAKNLSTSANHFLLFVYET